MLDYPWIIRAGRDVGGVRQRRALGSRASFGRARADDLERHHACTNVAFAITRTRVRTAS